MKKLVNIKELKVNHPSEYDTHYQKYCTAQWEFPLEEDWYIEGLNETPWLDVDKVHYNIGYSQGDYAYFTGRVLLDKFLEEKDTENDYFVLVEAMKLQDCSDRLLISGSHRGGHATFDDIEWWGQVDWFEDAVVERCGENRSILEGMDYKEYNDLCQELIGDLYTWVKEVCEQRMNKLYWEIREDIDHQMSEEAFEEWAESMDEQFEVEIDDDQEKLESHEAECGGAVSTDEVSRLAA